MWTFTQVIDKSSGLPGEGLEIRIRRIDLRTDAQQTHQGVTVITGKIFGRLSIAKAFQGNGDELELV